MRSRLLLAALVAGAALVPAGSASACDPNTFPNCQTYCGAIAWRYHELAQMTDLHLPPWPQTGVAGCP